MKTKAIVIMILCALLSSPLFAADPNYAGSMSWIGEVDDDWNAICTDPYNWDSAGLNGGDPNDPNAPWNQDGWVPFVPGGLPTLKTDVKIGDPCVVESLDDVIIYTGDAAFANQLEVAIDGVYSLTVQSGASLETAADLIVGDDGVGLVTIGAGNTITVGDDLYVGDEGTGTFNMTGGGTLDVNDYISVSKDEGGTGIMSLTGVQVNCQSIRVASDGADAAGTGVGTLTVVDCNIVIDGGDDDLYVGMDGTGTATFTNTLIDVDDDIRIGENGTGTLTLNNSDITKYDGTRDADHLDIGANEGGDGTLILNDSTVLTDNNVCVGGDDGANSLSSDVPTNSTGLIELNGSSHLYSHDQMKLGSFSGSTGTVILNDPCCFLNVNDGDEDLQVGGYGTGYLELNGGTVTCGALRIARGGGSTGTVTINDPCAVLEIAGGKDLQMSQGSFSTSTLTMNGNTIAVDDDAHVGMDNGAVCTITMVGGLLDVGDDIFFATGKEDDDNDSDSTTVSNLTMSAGAILTSAGGDIYIAKDGSSELNISDGAAISTDNRHNIMAGENVGSNADIEIDGAATTLYCRDLELGVNGGVVLFDIENATITLGDDLLIANSVGSGDPCTVSVIIDNQATINIGNAFELGGGGAIATVELRDGDIIMVDNDDAFLMPESESNVDRYARVILGTNVNGVNAKDPGDAEFKLDGPLDNALAGVDDYVDFLGGGRFTIRADGTVSEDDIRDNIAIGYVNPGFFRTSYSQADLNGVVPGAGEAYQVTYSRNGDNWEVELGIGLIPPVCVAQPAGDLSGDCEVDNDDVAILSAGWGAPYGLAELADIATTWFDCGTDWGDCDDNIALY